jgi:diphthine synthase
MLVLVGLGLADETDITVKGLEAVKSAVRVYLEAYTSILLVDKERLVSFRLLHLACSPYCVR